MALQPDSIHSFPEDMGVPSIILRFWYIFQLLFPCLFSSVLFWFGLYVEMVAGEFVILTCEYFKRDALLDPPVLNAILTRHNTHTFASPSQMQAWR
jgi:hypothetical protein